MNDSQGMIHPMIPQGSGYCPERGNLWRQGNLIYWEDGGVVNLKEQDSYIIRYMRLTDGEDYSKWTDEQRAQAQAKKVAEWEEYKAELAKAEAEQNRLIESAQAKLTAEEFEAVCDFGRHQRED